MSILLKENLEKISSTSAFGSITHPITSFIDSRISIISLDTTTSGITADQDLLAAMEMTTSGIALPSTSSSETTQKALSELRRLSGLTWEQLAKVFNVSRRSLHFWASGKPLSSSSEEQLNRVLGAIQYIDRGSASLNRSLLLKPDANGNLPIDLLIAGKYEEFKQTIGIGNAPQKLQLGSLSEDVYKARMPQNPEDLVDALQDSVHRNVGKSRRGRAARSRKNSSDQ